MEQFLYFGIGLLLIGIFAVMLRLYFAPWLKCQLAGYPLSLRELVHIVTKGAKPGPVSDAYLITRRANLKVSIADLTKLYLASPNRFHDEVLVLVETSRRN